MPMAYLLRTAARGSTQDGQCLPIFFSCLSGYPLNALPIIPTLRGVHHLRRKCPRENFQSTLEWGRAIQEEVSLVQTKAMKQMMGTTSSMRNRALQKTLDQ